MDLSLSFGSVGARASVIEKRKIDVFNGNADAELSNPYIFIFYIARRTRACFCSISNNNPGNAADNDQIYNEVSA